MDTSPLCRILSCLQTALRGSGPARKVILTQTLATLALVIWCVGVPTPAQAVERSDARVAVAASSRGIITVGGYHACVLHTDGTIDCWWTDSAGDLARITPPAGTFVQVSAGFTHTCAVKITGAVTCWGDNSHGQSNAPSGTFRQVSVGLFHTCGVKTDGSIACWGLNDNGQAPTSVSGAFREVSAGGYHTCAVTAGGGVICWGRGNPDDPIEPMQDYFGQATPAAGLFRQVSAGPSHTCAVKNDGTLACWGDNRDGQATPPSGTFTQVSTAMYRTCGLKSDGTLMCWGNPTGQAPTNVSGGFLEIATGDNNTCALRVDGTVTCWNASLSQSGVRQPDLQAYGRGSVSAGKYHTCAVKNDGTLACWGDNRNGQATPPSGTFRQVSAGGFHTCGLKVDGTVTCWGDNGKSQAPTSVSGVFIQISAGESHTCGLKADGTATCWGDNNNGQSPSPAQGIFVQISAGAYHTCGLRDNGTVTCGGDNFYGQAPTQVVGTFVQISAGFAHTCGVEADGTATCWGNNSNDQAPVSILGIFTQVSAGSYHTCGLTINSTVTCWGAGTMGTIGDPNYGQAIAQPEAFIQISAGALHTCALKTDGTVFCSGAGATNTGVYPEFGQRSTPQCPLNSPALRYVNAAWAGTTEGMDPDGTGPATSFGYNAFATIQSAIDAQAVGCTIAVTGGTYNESVNLNKAITVTLSGHTTVTGNVVISAGTFNPPPGNLSIGGNFTQSGGTFDGHSAIGMTVNGDFALSGGTFNGLGGTGMTLVGNFTQMGGAFNGSNGNASVTGAFTLSGGTFIAPRGTLTMEGELVHTDGTFDSAQGSVVLNTSGTLFLRKSMAFYNLTINNSTTLDTRRYLATVDGTLTNNGQILHTAADGGVSTYIDGNGVTTMQLSDRSYYGFLNNWVAQGGTNPYDTCGSPPPDVVKRYWKVEPISGFTATTDFTFRTDELNGQSLANLSLLQCSAAAGPTWRQVGTGYSTSTSGAYITFHATGVPFPVYNLQRASTFILVTLPATTVTSINRVAGSPTNAGSVSWTVAFANPVGNLTTSNFSLVNTGLTGPAITGVSPVGNVPATNWTVTASTGTGQGSLGLNLVNDSGLDHSLSTLPFTGQVYTVDKTAPTVSLSSTVPDSTNVSPIPVTVQFSEGVAGFTQSEIMVGNATVSNFTSVDVDTYTFNLTPSGQGTVTASIAANVAQDTAGNGNTAASQFSRLYDNIAPTVSLSSTAPNSTNVMPILVKVQFSEGVSGFTLRDITPGNAAVNDLFRVASDTYVFNLFPMGQGTFTASIAANVAQDTAGNGNTAASQFSRTFDNIAPTIRASATKADNKPYEAGTWTNQSVTVQYTCSDGGFEVATCPADQTFSAEGVTALTSGSAIDHAGNSASVSFGPIKIDKTAPTLNPSVSPNPVLLNGSATATPNASDEASGVTASSCNALNTSAVGSKSVSCTASDQAGNSATTTATYSVIYNFTGFFSPIVNPPDINSFKAGERITVKFGLTGNQGLNIFAANSPASQEVDCTTKAPVGSVTPTSPLGSKGLSYARGSDQYNYTWQTNRAWNNTCRQLVLTLNDGTHHTAYFQFMK